MNTAAIPPLPSSRRLGVLLGLIALAIAGLVGRVAYLQTVFADRMGEKAQRQHIGRQTVAARRGGIFDRNGLMLAGTVQTQAVFADPQFMLEQYGEQVEEGGKSWFDFDLALEAVATIVKADPDQVALALARDPEKRYVPLARGLSDEDADDLAELASELDLKGLGTTPEPRRVYSMGQTLAHVLGAVGRDDIGLEGLERRHDESLRGTDGSLIRLKDKRRHSIDTGIDGFRAPRHGTSLVLTIDSTIQLIVEEELAETVRAYEAKGASVVLMNPDTGDIIAMASYPTYYPQYLSDSDADARRNRAIVDPYEPGSVVKPFLMAGMLEAGLTTPQEVVETGKSRYIQGARRITDDYGYTKLNAWDAIVKSSNIAMVTFAMRTDYKELTDIYRRFGFGRKSGIDLDGENAGLIYKKAPDSLTQSRIAFGYAMMTTPMQLACAMSAIANGGTLVTPRLVAGYVRSDGTMEAEPLSAPRGQAVRPETASLMLRMLADVFPRGTMREFRSEKYNLFGKTGTAHQSDKGQQSETKYFASFVGGGPYESPRLVIAINVDQPKKELGYHGGQVAGACAARILERSLSYLGVPHSPQLEEPPEYVRDSLFSYLKRAYEPTRTLKDSPEEELLTVKDDE